MKPRVLLPNPDRPGTLLVPLTRGYSAVIDARDGEEVGKHCWTAITPHGDTGTVYAYRQVQDVDGKQKVIYLHRFLFDLWQLCSPPEIDHEDGNGLNNLPENLRGCTGSQNMMNTRGRSRSGYKGVTFHRQTGRYFARIKVAKRTSYLGLFDTAEEAHAAYCAAAERLHGEFARLA